MGILVRSGPLSHPAVQKAILDYCVPVVFEIRRALPTWVGIPGLGDPEAERIMASPDEDPEVAAFLAIHSQDPMTQGIWITTPDGKLLRSSYQTAAAPMLGTIEAALRDWRKIESRPPLPLPESALVNQWPETSPCPSDVTRLKVFGRLLDGSNFEPFRDDIDIPKSIWGTFLPQKPAEGAEFELPRPFLLEIATRFYSGEMRMRLRPEEVQSVRCKGRIVAVKDGVAEAELRGEVSIKGAVAFSLTREREYQAQLRGLVRWRPGDLEPKQFLLVADGNWRSQYPEDMTELVAYDVYPAQSIAKLVWCPPTRMIFLVEYPPAFVPGQRKPPGAQQRTEGRGEAEQANRSAASPSHVRLAAR